MLHFHRAAAQQDFSGKPALSVAMDKVPLPVFCSLELPTREPDPVHV